MVDIEIKKDNIDNIYHKIVIKNDIGYFDIRFAPNLDLYWYFSPYDTIDHQDSYTICIRKEEDYYFYCLLENLYNAIKKGNCCSNSQNVLYEPPEYNNDRLFVNNKVIWYSDDYPIEEASSLIISKEEEKINLTFTKSQSKDYIGYNTFAIRIRNSGSRYKPFNISFMNMYHDLLEYDYQISIDEIIYKRKRQK